MPKKSPHPYCVWRNGRPRFSPSPQLRAEGHADRDLKHDDGSWFSFGETCDFARAFMRERAATPKAKRGRPKAGEPRRLSVVEARTLDARRQLVLIRRDGVEHLLLLSPNAETVVETGIPARENAP